MCKFLAVAFLLVCPLLARADDFHIEFTANYWLLNPAGSIQTSTGNVDLRSDLGIRGRKGEGLFKVVFKPAAKHRLNFEMIPYRLNGTNNLTRTFTFGGRTYLVQDRITSQADVNYFFWSYQYDVVNNAQGHAGIVGGIAYFDASATATSERFGSGSEERKIPIPLAGGEFRVFPIPASRFFNINGEVKGIGAGAYGHYIQTSVSAGFAIARSARLQAGFYFVDADVHESKNTRGLKMRFNGPIFSVQLHD